MQQNRNFKIGIERPDGTIEELCDIVEIKEIEPTAEVDQVDGIDYFENVSFTFNVTDNFNRIGRIFNVLNNVRKYRGLPMRRVKAFEKSHRRVKQMQQDKLIAVDLAKEPSETNNLIKYIPKAQNES